MPAGKSKVKQKLFQTLLCVSLVLALASTGLCAFLSPHTATLYCKRNHFLDHGILAAPSGSCEVLRCDLVKAGPFLLPNSSAGHVKTESRQVPQSINATAIQKTLKLFPNLSSAEALRHPLLSFPPAPLFSLHCSLIR